MTIENYRTLLNADLMKEVLLQGYIWLRVDNAFEKTRAYAIHIELDGYDFEPFAVIETASGDVPMFAYGLYMHPYEWCLKDPNGGNE